MSRIRSVHPGFFTDEDIVSVSMAARLLFIGLGVEADDKGIFEWKPLTLKMRIFPADNIDLPALLAELEGAGKVRPYEIDGKRYGAISNFGKYQKPKSPNDVHPATDEVLEYAGYVGSKIPQNGEAVPKNGEMKKAEVKQFPQNEEIPLLMEEGEEDGEDIEPDGSRASGDAPVLRPEHVVEKWNELAPTMGKPRVRDLTPERRQLLKARIAQYPIDDFVTVFGNIRGSPFLRGDTGKQFCTFDWAMKKANFQKILEGNYNGQSA